MGFDEVKQRLSKLYRDAKRDCDRLSMKSVNTPTTALMLSVERERGRLMGLRAAINELESEQVQELPGLPGIGG